MCEEKFYSDLGIKSKILNLTKVDLHLWTLITNLTGNNNNIFPLSYSGQMILSFSAYIVVLGPVAVALAEFINYRITKKRIHGMKNLKLDKHIVIIGWKDNTIHFLEELTSVNNTALEKKHQIVCIVQNPEELIKNNENLKKLHIKRTVEFVKGDARDKDALMRAALHKAHTVVILAEGTSIEADEKTLLRALAISRYCRKKTLESQHEKTENISELIELQNANKYEDKIYIIAELNDVSLTADLKNSDVNEIINSSEYSKNILIQSMFNHGVSKILDEVLSHNSYNEFYTINLREKQFKPLIGKTFDELLPVLRQKGILLIAIKVVYHDTNGNEIIDENRLLSLLQAEELERQVIVNPTKPREIDRKVDSDDQLIVFCTDYKVLTDFS